MSLHLEGYNAIASGGIYCHCIWRDIMPLHLEGYNVSDALEH